MLDPKTVHELGVERFEQIQTERDVVAAELGFATPAEAIADRTARGEHAPQPRGPGRDGRGSRSGAAGRSLRRSSARLPSANCQVRRVEEFREADEPFAFYNPPTEDRSRPGSTTSTRTTSRTARCTTSRRSPTTRRTPATISRSRSNRRRPDARRSAGSAARSPGARTARAGASIPSGSPTRWGSIWTDGSGSACSTTRRIARLG